MNAFIHFLIGHAMLLALNSLRGLRVLIVEDEPLIAMMVEQDLRDFNCTGVMHARDNREALSALPLFFPHVAILDLQLTDERIDMDLADGLAAAGIPFVFVTGRQPDDIPERHRDRPFLAKPYMLEDLRATVQAACLAPVVRMTSEGNVG